MKKLHWVGISKVNEYLTMKDRMQVVQVNRASQEYYMSNSLLWVDYYKTNINTDL
jgi:hypothetical protein